MTYRWEDFELDLDGYRLTRKGAPLTLEPKAFNLLALLSQRPGHVFTKQEIFDAVWPDTVVSDHALTRVVAQLRRVLGDEAREARYIETVPTRGYRWIPRLTPVEPPDAPPTPTQTPDRPPPSSGSHRAVLAALAALALLAVVGIGAWRQHLAADPPAPRAADVAWPVQVTTNPGLDLYPAFSPQNDAIAYASDRSGRFEIYVRGLADTAREAALTIDGGVQPAWSPDGALIAYHSQEHGGIWVVPARGGVARQVAVEGAHPAWSPDGQRIAFQLDEPADATPAAFGAQSGSTLWMVGADGEGLRPLTDVGGPLGGHAAPAWSHDGRWLAFSVFDSHADRGVWMLDVETRETRVLERGRGFHELAFAPDDSAVFAAGGEPWIARFPLVPGTKALAGARETIPVPGVSGLRGLSVSATGDRLAFAGIAMTSHIWAQPIGADGAGRGPARPVTRETSRRNSLPAISPDGTRIAYVSQLGGEAPNIWVVDVDGGDAWPLTTGEDIELQPYWCPDGRCLVFKSSRPEGMGLWTIDLGTRRERPIPDFVLPARAGEQRLAGSFAELALSPSLSRVAFTLIAPPSGLRQLFVTPVGTLSPRALTTPSQWVGYPVWSPDETRLAVELKVGSSTHAAVIDPASATLTPLTADRGQTWVRSWSPDGRRIAAAAFRAGVWDIRSIDVATGRQQVITPAAGPHVYMRYPEWSPRGDLVIFERGELRGNIWTLPLDRRSASAAQW